MTKKLVVVPIFVCMALAFAPSVSRVPTAYGDEKGGCWVDTDFVLSPNRKFIAQETEQVCSESRYLIVIESIPHSAERNEPVFESSGKADMEWRKDGDLIISVRGETVPSKSLHAFGSLPIHYKAPDIKNEDVFISDEEKFYSRTKASIIARRSTFVGNISKDQDQLEEMMRRRRRAYWRFKEWCAANVFSD